jgi:addiction module HigA family antidote
MRMYNPAHPGKLIADILENGNLSIGNTVSALAKHIGVTRAALSRVVNGKAAVSADMALRLEDALGVEMEMWLGMQLQRDIWVASRKKRKKVKSVVMPEERKAA